MESGSGLCEEAVSCICVSWHMYPLLIGLMCVAYGANQSKELAVKFSLPFLLPDLSAF